MRMKSFLSTFCLIDCICYRCSSLELYLRWIIHRGGWIKQNVCTRDTLQPLSMSKYALSLFQYIHGFDDDYYYYYFFLLFAFMFARVFQYTEFYRSVQFQGFTCTHVTSVESYTNYWLAIVSIQFLYNLISSQWLGMLHCCLPTYSRSHRIFVFNSINFLWFHKSFMCIALFSLVSIENHNKLLRRSWKVFLSLLGCFFHTHTQPGCGGVFGVYWLQVSVYKSHKFGLSFSLLYILYETFNIPINAALIPLLNAKASLSLGVLHTYISPNKSSYK